MFIRPNVNRLGKISDEEAERILAAVRRKIEKKRATEPPPAPPTEGEQRMRDYWQSILGS